MATPHSNIITFRKYLCLLAYHIKILDYVATIASNIADVGMEKLREAEEEEDAVSQFVLSFERQLSNVELDDGESISITRPNVAVQVTNNDESIN